MLQRIDNLEGDLPDVVGPNWIEWGNDTTVAAAAIDVLHGATAPTNRPTATEITGALACTVNRYRTGSRGGLEAVFVVEPGSSNYTGTTRVTFTESGTGKASPYTAHVSVGAGGTVPEADNVPVGETGATAPPDTCTAVPTG